MSVGLDVRYYRSEITENLQAYTLRVVVTNAVNMPSEIFVFQIDEPAATDSSQEPVVPRFICLADPVDLEEYPVGSPDLQNEIPYFRDSEVTLIFRDMTTLEEVKDLIDEDISHLVNSLNALENVAVMEDKTYGTVP